MEWVRIVLLAMGAAVSYGIVHDQVTARVCVEYFTVAHPPVFGTDDPTLLGLGWGILATWWVGLILGILLAVAARADRRPKLGWRDLARPLALLLLVMALLAASAGLAGYLANRHHPPPFPPHLRDLIPRERRAVFHADWLAHTTSYASGFLGGIVLCIWTWIRRRRRASPTPDPGLGTVD